MVGVVGAAARMVSLRWSSRRCWVREWCCLDFDVVVGIDDDGAMPPFMRTFSGEIDCCGW